jgi:glycosyltransferase involved in cell wall biosynthesis
MKKPIVHAYFLCYNEAHILPHLLDHYLNFCEKIYIVDNFSTDESEEIINSFENTEIIKYDSKNELRDDLYVQIKNSVWKKSRGVADYVIVGDADEFLYHKDMKGFLTKSFSKGISIFKPEGYHMVADESLDLTENDNIFKMVKNGVRTNVLDKMMMFDCNKIEEINFGFGCHVAQPKGDILLSDDNNLKMLHYKFLGIKNHLFRNNIRRERLSEFNKKYGLGSYYQYTDEQVIDDYRSYLMKQTTVL